MTRDNIRERTCRQCGGKFQGGPRAWYCPQCRIQRNKEAAARYRAKGRADRPLGSVDLCVRCGAQYVVHSARQKYCPDCVKEAYIEAKRPMCRAWNQAHKETYYAAKNAKRREQRKENPEEVRAKERKYRSEHRDKYRSKSKKGPVLP